MGVALNHTIVHVRDRERAARELASLLGLAEPTSWGPFCIVALDHGVSLDFADTENPTPQHYAFLVSEPDFDSILARLKERGHQIWADPRKQRPGEINTNDGGRGVYWDGPDGHYLEIITRPYGG